MQHDDLLEERKAEYGAAYAITDKWITENHEALAMSLSPFSLILIHNKITRALVSPNNRDHYDDIIGYAKLLLQEWEDKQPLKSASKGPRLPKTVVETIRSKIGNEPLSNAELGIAMKKGIVP